MKLVPGGLRNLVGGARCDPGRRRDARTDEAGNRPAGRRGGEESLTELLGGARGAVDATAAPAAFVVGWLLADRSVGAGAVAAVIVAAATAGWRLRRGEPARAVLVGLLVVALSAAVAVRTGRAADFFLVQLAMNAASALAWTVSIVLRWPLLGVVVGAVLGQRATWRHDPVLLGAYARASWVWVSQYVLRVAVFVPLWWADQVVALGLARIVLSWPLVAGCLAVSWWALRRAIPADHPGLRHPRTA
jgi:hypothetical protein